MVCFFYKGSQKNCTDTEGNQYQRPQSEANSSINSLHRWRRWCIEQGSNLPMVKRWTVGRARHKLKNTWSPGLIIITGSSFFAFRSCWMPCTDQDKFLPMDGSIGRHLAATAGRPGAMSYLLAYLLRSLLMDKEFGRINQQPTVILWSSRPSYLEANALSIVFLVQRVSFCLTGAHEDWAHPYDTSRTSALMVVMELFESTAGAGVNKYKSSLDVCVYVATGDYCSAKAGCLCWQDFLVISFG